MKIKSYVLGSITVGVFIAGIIISMALNFWKTESSKEPTRYIEGEFTGEYNPADIRGSYSFGDIENSFGISADELSAAFNLKGLDNPAEFQVKEFEEYYEPLADGGEIGTDSVRLFVATYLGLPYTPEETTRLPMTALEALKKKIAVADFKVVEVIGVEVRAIDMSDVSPESESEDSHESDEDMTIKGNTTFNDLNSWGIDSVLFKELTGYDAGPSSMTVRNYAAENGIEFSEIKTAVQDKLDANK